jgi:hypothetical protein
MSTIIREPYPEAKKLSKSNVAMWTHYMQYQMMDWPDLGSAIQSKHKYVIERPQRDSCWSGISVRKYTLNPASINAGPATPTPSLHSRKMKHSSILSSDPTSFFAPILATSQPATTAPRMKLQRCTKRYGLLQPLAWLPQLAQRRAPQPTHQGVRYVRP